MQEYIDTAYWLESKLIYKKLKNRYRIFCMKCQRYEYVSKEEMKQIRASHICPMCFQEITPTTIQEHHFVRYIADADWNGYRVYIGFTFGQKPKADVKHVFRYTGGYYGEARYICCNMNSSFGYCEAQNEWKRRIAQNYMWRFHSLRYDLDRQKTKREYIYTSLWDDGYKQNEIDKVAKSNQRKIIEDNLMNARQMEYVIAFDLKSYEQVYKYRVYMRKNSPDIYKPLNVYYLDYLYRNKIPLRDFYDYMEQCKLLGFKLDKPKDFQYRHQVLSELCTEKRNEAREKAIKKRYAALLKKAYVDGDIEIKPFRTGDEIRKCGKTLHNCIGSMYLGSYADGKTDLYYLSKKGRMKVAIEVNKKRLIQAREDRNAKCSKAYMKHIKKWCETNRFKEALY